MNESTTSIDRFDRRAALQLLAMARRRARNARLGAKMAAAVAALALVSSIATVVALTREAPFDVTGGTIRALLLLDVILLLALAALIVRPLTRLWTARREGLAGSKLHGRLVRIFALIAVGPPILMAIFSAVLFEFGIQSWFSDKVRSTLQDSLVVAESYVAEHRQVIRGDILAMAVDLNRQALFLQQDTTLLRAIVEDQTAKRALSEAIVFTGSGIVLARATLNLELAPERVPDVVMERLNDGDLVLVSETEDDRVRALVKLEDFINTYLYVSRFVNSNVVARADAVRASIAEYENLEGERSSIQFQTNAVFFILAFLILLIAVWIGLSLANQLVAPIASLVEASQKVGEGNLKVRVPSLKGTEELGTLGRAFNRMTKQLSLQQDQLMQVNRKLDIRRRFTEAVLSGVSAGVIGLDSKGAINLPNRAACEFLGAEPDELDGKTLSLLLPELDACFRELKDSAGDTVQHQVLVTRNGQQRMLLVRVAKDTGADSAGGFVVTFDDITEQLADQRTAAWADIARRIAHEIKNPLTPIQLSAERLQRKYKKEVTTDPEVFEQCTSTIIRQVGDLRRMVDEFSSFARMPEPIFKKEDLVDIVRQAVFLQEVGRPNIEYKLSVPKKSVHMICDGRQIAQALTNILNNAAESIAAKKLSGSDSRTKKSRIDVRLSVRGNKTLVISVCDDGTGLPEDLFERLTEPYVTTRGKGTGLGLAIVRKVVEDHAGQLVLENRKDGGARVAISFDLPALVSRAQESGKKAPPPGQQGDPALSERVKEVGHGT